MNTKLLLAIVGWLTIITGTVMNAGVLAFVMWVFQPLPREISALHIGVWVSLHTLTAMCVGALTLGLYLKN